MLNGAGDAFALSTVGIPGRFRARERQTGHSRQRDQQVQQIVEQQRGAEERQPDIAVVAFQKKAILDRLDAPEVDPVRPELARQDSWVFAQARQPFRRRVVAALGRVCEGGERGRRNRRLVAGNRS